MFIPIEFQKAFQKTEQTAFAITADYTDNPDLLASRFGGLPYWQAEKDTLTGKNGQPLGLLAQINFAEIPPSRDLPQSGLLQFFVPTNDECYGANLENVGGKSQLVAQFWDAPSLEKATEWHRDIDEHDLIPVFGAHALTFAEKLDYAGVETIECAEALNANPFEVLEDVAINEKEEHMFYQAITEHVDAGGHQLLGYPKFINGDPRENSDYRLLLQIDTDMNDDNDIMWGDDGIGQIFIRDADLKSRLFNKAWLYWDC